MRTLIRLGGSTILIGTVLFAWWLRSSVSAAAIAIGPGVVVAGATPNQLEMGRWAAGRFETAGLAPPRAEIEFHGDRSGCNGHLGFAWDGHVDVCTTLVNVMARYVLLHEMSHLWLDQNVDAEMRNRFLELRELSSWNASGDPWELRGYEQGAEIIAWGLGERILTAHVPEDHLDQIAAAYELLTGDVPLPAKNSAPVKPSGPGEWSSARHRALQPGAKPAGYPQSAHIGTATIRSSSSYRRGPVWNMAPRAKRFPSRSRNQARCRPESRSGAASALTSNAIRFAPPNSATMSIS